MNHLSPSDHAEAAAMLLEAERTRTQSSQLSAKWPNLTVDDAYAVQAMVIEAKTEAGARVIGHKVGLTSKAMQRSSGIDEPDYGHLLDDMVIEDGGVVTCADFCAPRVEMELAFILGSPLRGPGLGLLDVLRATEFVVPSIELIDARVQDPRKFVDTVSDNGAAAGIILGGRPIKPTDVDLRSVAGILHRNGDIEETGVAAGVLGHPALGVAWLANKVAPFGTELEAGHVVLSGSFVRPVWAEPGDVVRAEFVGLGDLTVRFD